jgi:Uma2 family endonuclease
MVLTRLYTIEDLRNIATEDDNYELIEGVLAPMPPVDFDHGSVHANLFLVLATHVRHNALGQVVSEVGFTLHRDPDSVLAPDLAFVPAYRYPEMTSGFAELAPDLVVEVISPGNSPGDIERKVAIYLGAGVKAIWIVYPRQRQVVVHTPDNPPAVFIVSEQIDGGDVLPGLTVPVVEIFS